MAPRYSWPSSSDKNTSEDDYGEEIEEEDDGDGEEALSKPCIHRGGRVMEGERVLSDGILSKTATYRVIVSGAVGPKELDRLIKKLEMDKAILADESEVEDD